MLEWLPILMFGAVFVVLLAGYPVALSLAGVALLFASVGIVLGVFDAGDLGFLPGRLFGIVTNQILIAVPLFIFMGVMLEKTRIAETLLSSLSSMLGQLRGGLAVAVIVVGMLLAASTGIVGDSRVGFRSASFRDPPTRCRANGPGPGRSVAPGMKSA